MKPLKFLAVFAVAAALPACFLLASCATPFVIRTPYGSASNGPDGVAVIVDDKASK